MAKEKATMQKALIEDLSEEKAALVVEVNRQAAQIRDHAEAMSALVKAKDATFAANVDLVRKNKELLAEFGDLKERLQTAEAENQRMRGYIQRVQEDDLEASEIVTTGDPHGEEVLVPKRRPTRFGTPSGYGTPGYTEDRGFGHSLHSSARPRHWIRYGED